MMKKTYLYFIALTIHSPAYALEFVPGDYEMLPPDKSIVLTYFQATESHKMYSDHRRVAGNNKFHSEATLLRYIYGYRPTPFLSIEPQLIVPWVKANTEADATPLGDSSGVGDIILGLPFKYRLNTDHGDIFSIAPYLYVPTGHYQSDQAVNIGANYWRYLLQAAYIHHFSDQWSLDTGADVSWVSTNHHYGRSHDNETQTPKYEYQLYLRYNLDPATQLGFGGGWIKGAGDIVNHRSLEDKVDTRYLRLSAAHFFTSAFQAELSLGRDLTVEQGFKQNSFLSIRLGYLF
ncbi:transporter [Rosenbergiella nectarea]|uniref:transporter n=1 Tax=Rosenbergiella nectarea TaxID=988801 RepID=UPI001F4F08BE|nr:transporter [Rosenbergiella nectarea]